MTTRRQFVSQAAALTGIAFMGCDGLLAARAQAPRRREVVVSGPNVAGGGGPHEGAQVNEAYDPR